MFKRTLSETTASAFKSGHRSTCWSIPTRMCLSWHNKFILVKNLPLTLLGWPLSGQDTYNGERFVWNNKDFSLWNDFFKGGSTVFTNPFQL